MAGVGGLVAAESFRVESEVFVNEADEPVARSLTLFREGITWDFREPVAERGSAAGQREIVLHDPARERVILINPDCNVKTQIESVRLERLGASLASWARRSDDRLVRWAGGPDFGEGMSESSDRIELVGPRVRYAVAFHAAPSSEAAQDYHRFADMAILLKALLRPGGMPPFPRLAINRRVAVADGIPASVALEIDSRVAMMTGRSESLRSVHRVHPRLLASDLDRIENAESHLAVAAEVPLVEFMQTSATVGHK